MPPISCKTEITDGAEEFRCFLYIIYKQTSLFKNVNLPFSRYGLMRISDSHK